MISFSNLNVWDEKKREFSIKNIEVKVDPNIKLKETNIEGSNLYALPPGIDIHVHFREPGFEHKENFATGAEAAIFGGILAVLDMPNTNPITDSVKSIIQKKELAKKQQYIDILIASAITSSNIYQLNEIDQHCDAYKIYLSESFGNLAIEENDLREALTFLEKIESTKTLIFHAEDPQILSNSKNEVKHARQRPAEAEASAVQMILGYARDYPNLKFHITHLSSFLSLKLLELASRQNITLDTCSRYLWFDNNSEIDDFLIKVNPPIRNSIDRIELLRAFSTGLIDMISSDHSPHTLLEKKHDSLSGVPGVQELIPSVITLVQKGEIEWERAIESFHVFPKQMLNLPSNFYENSYIILNPNLPFSIDNFWLKTKVKWSIFQNVQLYGKPQFIIKNGTLILVA